MSELIEVPINVVRDHLKIVEILRILRFPSCRSQFVSWSDYVEIPRNTRM